jgi:PEP-CTERM motif
MFPFRSSMSALALALAAGSAQAASVHVQFDNPIFNGVPAPAYDLVAITYPALGTGAPRTVSTAAGRFQGTATNVVGVSPGIFSDSVDDLFMYCYDVYESVGSGWHADYTINFSGPQSRTLDFLGAVNAVLNQGQPVYDTYAWLHPTSGAMAAAVQLGIWESKYESAGWSLADGAFSASGIDAATQGHLSSFLAAIDGSASLEGRYAMTLEAAGVQDMITGDPPADVPEPGMAGLLGLAAAGAFWARRRPRS